MNVLVKYLLSVLLFSIVVSCSGVKVYTDYDKDINITIETNKGDIKMVLYATKTPKTVCNFSWSASI